MQNILKLYHFYNDINKVEKFGNGHINKTFVVTVKSNGYKYIVQQINTNVFKRPVEVMENIESVTKYIRDVACNGHEDDVCDPKRAALEIVKTNDNKTYVKWDNTYWRCYKFVSGARTYEIIENPEMFYEVGLAVGLFQKQLNEFPIDDLHITIPDFHNTPVRYQRFLTVSKKDEYHRGLEAFNEVKFLLDRAKHVNNLTKLIDSKEIPIRVTHNDTKLNNVMIDEKTNKAICLIDLDTVMPGSVLYDFGDAIRVGASTAVEDEPDLDKVKLNLELFEAFSRGFLEKTHCILTPKEKENLVEGARIITLECGMRFLTDYLEKDVYFHTSYDNHNLVRARTQFKLVEEIEKNYDIMKNIINNILKSLEK